MSTARLWLRTRWHRMRTVPGLGKNVVTLVVLVAFASIAGVIVLSAQGSGLSTWPWTDRFRFQAAFDDAHGVAPGQGQEVRIAGVTVGAIEGASVGADGKAVLELGIERGHRIFDNATLVLRPKSPLNEMYVTIQPGGPPGKPIAEGALLPAGNTKNPVTIDRVTEHLDDDARQALSALLIEADVALAGAAEHLPSGLDGTERVLADLRPVMEQLQSRRNTLARLVSSLGTVADAVGGDHDRVSALAGDLRDTLRVLGEQSGPLDASLRQLPDLADRLKGATDAVQGLSGQLDPTLDNLHAATGALPDALAALRDTAKEASPVIDKAIPVAQALRPVAADLRPVVANLKAAMPDLLGITGHLDPVTAALVPSLEDLRAFTYNTASVTSIRNGNGAGIRAHAVFSPESIPLLDALARKAN